MKRTWCCLPATVTSFFLLFMAQTVQGETLNEAVGLMISTNPDIRSVAHNRLARDQELRQSRSGFWPKIDANVGAGFDDFHAPIESKYTAEEYTLSLRQNIYAGLSTVHEEKRQKARINSSAYSLRGVSENTALRASEVYLEVLRTQELLEIAKENKTIHQRISDQIQLRSESGVASRSNIDQANGRLALASSNVIVAQINLEDAKSNYLAVIGRMPENLVKPDSFEKIIPSSLEEAIKKAEDNHPTLKSSLADLQARKMQHEVARSPFLPVVDIEYDKRWRNNSDYDAQWEEEDLVMLRLRYNFFHGWNDEARKQETSELIKEAQEISQHTKRQVVESTRLSWMAYQAVADRMKYLEQHVEAITKTADAFNKQWNIGQRTLLDVLDTEAEVIDSKRNLYNARYDGLYAQIRILNSMGTFIDALGLKLPEEASLIEE